MSQTVTAETLGTITLPNDMRDEAAKALGLSGDPALETALEYARTGEPNAQPTHYLYFPNSYRGAVCCGGNSDWTDCGSLADLMDRWQNYDERWSA